MNTKELLIDFVITFGVGLVSAALVTFLYSLFVHGAGAVDWGTSFRLAIILGIVLSFTNARKNKK